MACKNQHTEMKRSLLTGSYGKLNKIKIMTANATSILKRTLLLLLVFAGLYFAQAFLIPFAIAAVLATLFLPFCQWMERKKLPRIWAVTCCVLVLVIVMAGIGMLLGWQISELAKDFGTIKEQFSQMTHSIHQYIFKVLGLSVEKQMEMLKEQGSSIKDTIPLITGSLILGLTNLVLTLVYVFLLLYYRIHIKNFILIK